MVLPSINNKLLQQQIFTYLPSGRSCFISDL